MATPRKHYFRCADAILREPWSRDQKLTLVLLMAHLNSRWRRDGIPHEEAGNCVLSRGDLALITGRVHFRFAANLMSTLSELVSFSIEIQDGFVAISWPKFAEFQEFDSRNKGQSKADQKPLLQPPPSPTPSPSKLSNDNLLKRTRAPRVTASRPDEISEQLWTDWLSVRRAKRAGPPTATALAGIRREAAKAGVTFEAAIRESAERGWIGFKASWHEGDTIKRRPAHDKTVDNVKSLMDRITPPTETIDVTPTTKRINP